MSERENELMNLVLDGEATPDEQAELESVLQDSETARRRWESLRRMVSDLEALRDEEVPAGVAQALAESVHDLVAAPDRTESRIQQAQLSSASVSAERLHVLETPSHSGSDLTAQPVWHARSKGKGGAMNPQKRTRVLISFGAIAAVLVVAIAMWPPAFLKEQASGAIGAVQKHHAPQITAKDVVLSSETVRQAAKVAYGDYLADSAKLQNISAELGMSAANKSVAESASTLDNVSRELNSQAAELQNRYLGTMTATLNALSALLNRSSIDNKQLSNIEAEIAALNSAMHNRAQLGSAAMADMNAQLANVTKELNSAAHLSSSFAGSQAQLSSAFAEAETQLASAARSLSSASSVDAVQLQNATVQLQNVSHALSNRSALESATALASQQEYLESLSNQAKVLENVEADLDAVMANKAQLSNQSALASRVTALSSALNNQADALETLGIRNMEAQLSSQTAMANALRNMDESLTMANRAVGNRAGFESHAVESFSAEMSNATRQLQSASSELESLASASMQAELAAISSQLDSHTQLNNRLSNASDAEAAMASKIILQSQSSLAALQNQLNSISSALDNHARLGMVAANQAQLQSQAKDLQNRASLMSKQQD